MSFYEMAVYQPAKMLTNLTAFLNKAAAYAASKEFSHEVFLAARLAPDMFPLLRQVQSACDAAKFTAARLAGVEAPSHPDEEQTFAEIQARIQTTLEYLKTLTPEQFEGAGERDIELPFLPGQQVKGSDYLMEMALPNFYFHITTAYNILRHNGVDLGKREFIGSMRLKDA